MGTERPKSKRKKDTAGASLSLWALLARSSFYKILSAVALLAAAETAFACAFLWRGGGPGSLEALAGRFLYIFFIIGQGVVYLILIWTEERMETESRCTLMRLRIQGKRLFLIKAAYNVLCLTMLYAVQIWLAIGMTWLYRRSLEPGQASPQMLFLAFYQIGFLHGLLPLAEAGKWVRNILMLLALGTTAAGGMEVKGRVAKVIVLAAGGGCLASPVGLYFPDVFCCIVSVIGTAVSLPKAEEKP